MTLTRSNSENALPESANGPGDAFAEEALEGFLLVRAQPEVDDPPDLGEVAELQMHFAAGCNDKTRLVLGKKNSSPEIRSDITYRALRISIQRSRESTKDARDYRHPEYSEKLDELNL